LEASTDQQMASLKSDCEISDLRFTFISSSDVHSTFYPSAVVDKANHSGPSVAGGIAKRAYKLKSLRESFPRVFLFDCGDLFAGTAFFEEFLGMTILYWFLNPQQHAITY